MPTILGTTLSPLLLPLSFFPLTCRLVHASPIKLLMCPINPPPQGHLSITANTTHKLTQNDKIHLNGDNWPSSRVYAVLITLSSSIGLHSIKIILRGVWGPQAGCPQKKWEKFHCTYILARMQDFFGTVSSYTFENCSGMELHLLVALQERSGNHESH